MNKIKVLVVNVGEKPKTLEIEDSLESYRKIVNGEIEVFYIEKLAKMNIDVVINKKCLSEFYVPSVILEYGMFIGALTGNIFFVAHDEYSFKSLNREQIEYLNKIIKYGDYGYKSEKEDKNYIICSMEC